MPVFLAAGGEDEIAPIEHTRMMEAALRGAGVPVESLYYPTEGHGFYTQPHRQEYYARLLAFLKQCTWAGNGRNSGPGPCGGRRRWTCGSGVDSVSAFHACRGNHMARPDLSRSTTPQLTFRAVVLAIILAVVLSAANAYLGLFAGLTVATAIPAAVVSMGVLRLLGGGTIRRTTSSRPAPRPAPRSPPA